MRKKLLFALLLVLLLGLTLVSVIVVAAQTGGGIDLSWNVVSGGAGVSQNTASGYVLSSTVGQTAAGESQGSGVEMHHGFWQTFIDTLFTRLPLTVKH